MPRKIQQSAEVAVGQRVDRRTEHKGGLGLEFHMDEVDAEDRTGMTGAGGKGQGRNPSATTSGASSTVATREQSNPKHQFLLEEVLERGNIEAALRRVGANKGAPGVDGMTTERLKVEFWTQWPRIREEILEKRYRPAPVREVEIPKPGGKGMRKLGIPTVVDRLIQQALLQILSPLFETDFSEHSYGFRPGRNAHQAILRAREYVTQGKVVVVDIDLEKFFDNVNHDILMSRIARKIGDKRVLLLIRRYLQAGLMAGGIESPRTEGTPQGGPLSPLLSNIMLNELDEDLERRGHSFCRYADDCNIYVWSQKAGERVMESVKGFLWKRLKLRVNEEKSAVAPAGERKFLGYSMTKEEQPRLQIAKETHKRLKEKLKKKFSQARGKEMKKFISDELRPILVGWINYYQLTEKPGLLKELDKWIRHCLRSIIWRQLKNPRTRIREMVRRGIDRGKAGKLAWSHKGPWRCSKCQPMNWAYSNRYFASMGLISLLNRKLELKPL